MGTIADKLTYLSNTKTAIRNAIAAKGVQVSDSDTFRSYADKISSITGGTGEGLHLQEHFFNIEDRVTAKDVFIPADSITEAKVAKVNCVQETNNDKKTRSTLTISVSGNVTLLACIMYRGNNITMSDDYGAVWEQVVMSKIASYSSGDQKMIVFKAPVNLSAQIDIAVTAIQDTSARMSMKVFVLEGQKNVSVIENVLCASMPYTPSNQKTSEQIYLLSTVYAFAEGVMISQTYTGVLLTYNEQRFYAVFDPNFSAGNPTFNYSDASNYTPNTINAIVLGIE